MASGIGIGKDWNAVCVLAAFITGKQHKYSYIYSTASVRVMARGTHPYLDRVGDQDPSASEKVEVSHGCSV